MKNPLTSSVKFQVNGLQRRGLRGAVLLLVRTVLHSETLLLQVYQVSHALSKGIAAVLTNKWETLSQIQKRTKQPPNEVIKTVREMFKERLAEMKFEDTETGKTALWRKKSGVKAGPK